MLGTGAAACCDAVRAAELGPGLRVAEGLQHLCRIAPGKVLHRTVHCWHNRLTVRGLLYTGTIGMLWAGWFGFVFNLEHL